MVHRKIEVENVANVEVLPMPIPIPNWIWQHWNWQHFHNGNNQHDRGVEACREGNDGQPSHDFPGVMGLAAKNAKDAKKG